MVKREEIVRIILEGSQRMTKTPNGIMAHDVHVDRIADRLVKKYDLADVGGSLPSDEAKSWLKKYMGKKLRKQHPEYRTTENMVKYVFSKGWKMAKKQ